MSTFLETWPSLSPSSNKKDHGFSGYYCVFVMGYMVDVLALGLLWIEFYKAMVWIRVKIKTCNGMAFGLLHPT